MDVFSSLNYSPLDRMVLAPGCALKPGQIEACYFRQVFEESPFGMVLLEPANSRFLEVNRAFCDMVGYPPEELLTKTPLDITHPDDLAVEIQCIDQILSQDIDVHRLEKRFITKAGKTIWISFKSTVLKDTEDSLCFALGIVENITSRKMAEIALTQRTAELQAVLNAFPDTLFWTDATGTILDYRASPNREFGDPMQVCIGRSVTTVLPPPAGDVIFRGIQQTLRNWSTVSVEYALLLPSGRQDYEARLSLLQPGRVLVAVRNISSHKQIERDLRLSEARYRTLVENIPGVVYRFCSDPAWTVEFISEGVEALLGYPATDFAENRTFNFLSLVVPEDRERVCCEVEVAIAQRQPYQLEYRCFTLDYQERWILDRGQGYWDESGKLRYLDGLLLDITDLKTTEAQLAHRTSYDSLTELPNRSLFFQHLERAIQQVQSDRTYQFAVLVLDVDHFKVINDSMGHLVGDQLLIAISQRLRIGLRPRDVVARLGGDEFAVFLGGITALRDVTHIADRIGQRVTHPFASQNVEIVPSISIGITVQLSHTETVYTSAQSVVRDAEIAMYRAKQEGRSRFALFDQAMHACAMDRLQLELELRHALDQDHLLLYYQPIVNLEKLQIEGFEALIRWQDPEQGMILPSKFIPIAEETGLVVAIDTLALMMACRQLQQWQAQFPQAALQFVSVNLSTRHFQRPELVDQIAAVLQQTTLPPACLKLEITETVLMEDTDSALAKLRDLRQLGVQISLDDFGTGFSSLSYIHRFPLDTLKIDRSFITDLHQRQESSSIVGAIVALAKSLNLKVVAEGIEHRDHLSQLKRLSCEYGQGYLFARPLSVRQIDQLLVSRGGERRVPGGGA